MILGAIVASAFLSSSVLGATDKEKSLYERLGGYDAVSAVVDDFAGKLFEDPVVGARFFGMSDENLSYERFPRSCPTCSEPIRDAIQRFNSSGDTSCFDGLNCDCQEDWLRTVEALPSEYRAVI